MLSYYNRMAMYRQQCQLSAASGQFPNGTSPTGWYSSYHPGAQVHTPPQYLNCMQDADGQQMQMAWPHPHSVFNPEFFDYNYFQQQQQQQQQQHHFPQRTDPESQLPSPPMSSSEVSSPGAPGGSVTPPHQSRPAPVRSPYDWITKPSYQSQPNPEIGTISASPLLLDFSPQDTTGKTRTKDKYRVVYTDHQRLELEKEFHFSRYITIRRKAELAANLGLSERQVKIWFQNRRAKERKQVKKREELNNKEGILTTNTNVMQIHQQSLLHQQQQQQQQQQQRVAMTASAVAAHHQAQLAANHTTVVPVRVPLM